MGTHDGVFDRTRRQHRAAALSGNHDDREKSSDDFAVFGNINDLYAGGYVVKILNHERLARTDRPDSVTVSLRYGDRTVTAAVM